jgi:uncharacterized protein YicC (UPF0701 family)
MNCKTLVLVFLYLFLSGCASEQASNMQQDAAKIAELKCVSRKYTNQKFELAARYNKLDDQLLNKQNTEVKDDSLRSQLDIEKKELVKKSQVVSDSLLKYLRKVWNENYKTKEDKQKLDSLTEIEFKRICQEK